VTAREIDERVVQFGLEQHGVFTLRQTVELGVSSSMARRRVAAGLGAG